MSLLLDARKKSQQAQSALDEDRTITSLELSLEEHPNQAAQESDTRPIENARSAGQNLFAAKSPSSSAGRTLPNRNLLFALGGTILLLVIGAGYFWYLDSASNTTPRRPASAPPLAQAQPAAAQPVPQSALVPGITEPSAAGTIQKAPPFDKPVLSEDADEDVGAPLPQARSSSPARPNPIRIEQRSTEPVVDPLLNDAYLAYRNGKLDEAQQLYLAMFKKDVRNADALLGLATIAQQRGETQMAAQYYASVLALDPRNALANAGMSALSADSENNESRLKTLLREQGNSAALHFALGNLYAEQSRWGEAQQAYFNAYTLESGNAQFAFNLAVSLDHLGQGKLAVQHYQRALQLDQSHSAGFDHTQISQRAQELSR